MKTQKMYILLSLICSIATSIFTLDKAEKRIDTTQVEIADGLVEAKHVELEKDIDELKIRIEQLERQMEALQQKLNNK